MPESAKRFLFVLAACAVTAAGACSSSLARLVGVPSHDVNITPGAPQAVSGGDTVFFSIDNNGVNTAYVQPCGDQPALDLQVYQNGAWVELGPAVTCPAPTNPGPIELASGAQLVVAAFYTGPGHYRTGVSVGTDAALSDAAMAWTAGFDIK
jgi:hypothetical protein